MALKFINISYHERKMIDYYIQSTPQSYIAARFVTKEGKGDSDYIQ